MLELTVVGGPTAILELRYRPCMYGVSFRFSDGSDLLVADGDIARLTDTLWSLSAMPGAVSCVAQLDHERRQPDVARRAIALTVREGDALRLALSRSDVASRAYGSTS
jgi:hypothetical protein